MTKMLKLKKGVEESIQSLLTHLLENGKVKGVFALKKLSENKSGDAIAYSLITGKEAMAETTALYPLMPRNGGGLVSFLTQKGEVPGPTAVIIRPCELRALVELVKRLKGNMKDLFIISSTCGGVYPTKMAVNGELDKDLPNYWKAIKDGKIASNIRTACKGCEEFVPYNADMTVLVVGGGDHSKECTIFLNSAKAEEFAQGMDGKISDNELPSDALQKVRSNREAEKKKLYDELGMASMNLDGLTRIFGKCINCRGCRTACPICYCDQCTFDAQNFEYKLSESELKRKGGIRIPPGTIYYQLTRLAHVSISCAACGSCEDICPVDLPLATIFKKVGEAVQDVFEYLPGKDVEEEIPIKTFEIDELIEVED